MHRLCLSLLCLTACLPPAAAETRVLHVLQVFTLPRAEGLELLAQDLDDKALHGRLMDAARANPAVLEKLLLVSSLLGQEKVEVQQANEVLYPTEFDPQQVPQNVALGDAAFALAVRHFFEPPEPKPQPEPPKPDPAPKTVPDPSSHPAPQPERSGQDQPPSKAARHPANQGLGIITAITPIAFQMGLAGDKLILEDVTAAQKGEKELKVSLELSRFAGVRQYNGEPLVEFSHRKLETTLPLVLDAPRFLGTCTAAQCTGSSFESREQTVSFACLTTRKMPEPVTSRKPVPHDETVFQAMLEVFSLPRPQAFALVEERLDDAVFRERLRATVKTGAGRLESFLSGRALGGTGAVLAQTDAYLYPTQFDPPQVGQNIFIADDDLLADLRSGRQVGTGLAPSAATPYNAGFGLQTAITPTAFTTRELGSRLEIEILREDRRLTVKVKPQLTRLLGQRRYTGAEQPVFESDFLSTTTQAWLNVPHLLGTLSRPVNTGLKEENKEDRVWFGFITVRAVE